MSSTPIACTLSITDLAAVKERYREAADHYHASARFTDTRAIISLTGDRAYLLALLEEMVARESECCAFLSFDVMETHTGFEVTLHVSGDHEMAEDALRESVATMFPTATFDLVALRGAFSGLRPYQGRNTERRAAIQEAAREALDQPDA